MPGADETLSVKAIRAGVYISLPVFAAGLVANVFGYVNLASFVVSALLGERLSGCRTLRRYQNFRRARCVRAQGPSAFFIRHGKGEQAASEKTSARRPALHGHAVVGYLHA